MPSAPRAQLEGYVVTHVDYRLALDRARTSLSQEALVVKNDRGLTFRVTEALVSNFSAALVPCAPRLPAAAEGARLFRDVLWTRVFAGHSSVRDPSEVNDVAIEDFVHSKSPMPFGTRSFTATRYCRVHYQVSGAQGAATLQLSAERSADGAAQAFRIDTRLANSTVKELRELVSGEGERAQVTIMRSLAHLFDGIDAGMQDEKLVTRTIMRNLLDHTRIDVRLGR